MTTPDVERVKSISNESLRFFGAMSASVSHEIRNKLAVINEKAGLVEDIAVAMRSGRAPDPDRLETQARKIIEQIRQANSMVRALNRLAHSTDESDTTVDVTDMVALAVELYGRAAAMAQTVIDHAGPESEITVRSNPFLLVNAVGRCLGLAMERVDDSRILTVVTEPLAGGALVRMRRLAGIADNGTEIMRDHPGLAALLDVLGAEVTVDHARGELVLEITESKSHDHGGQP